MLSAATHRLGAYGGGGVTGKAKYNKTKAKGRNWKKIKRRGKAPAPSSELNHLGAVTGGNVPEPMGKTNESSSGAEGLSQACVCMPGAREASGVVINSSPGSASLVYRKPRRGMVLTQPF